MEPLWLLLIAGKATLDHNTALNHFKLEIAQRQSWIKDSLVGGKPSVVEQRNFLEDNATSTKKHLHYKITLKLTMDNAFSLKASNGGFKKGPPP